MLRRQDVLGGLLLVAFGLLGLALGASLDPGSARRMGAGFFPRVLSWLLILLGAAIAVPVAAQAREVVSRVRWRPVILITLAVLTFAGLIDRLGLIAATVATVILGAAAGRDSRALEALALAVTLALGAAGLFVYALGLPLPLWGR
jgi:hypothetical protein